MSVTNVIEVTFGNSNTVFLDISDSFRYNSGMILKFADIELPTAYQVHFSNSRDATTSFESIGDADGVLVPDDVYRDDLMFFAWIYLHPTDDSAMTKYEVQVSARRRAGLPDGTEPTPQEQTVIDQAITALNNAVAQTAEDVETTAQNAQDASDSADDAQGYANSAQGYAEQAEGYAESASTSATEASASATSAQTSASQASASAGTASAAATSASASAQSASADADRAEQAAGQSGYMFFYIDENGDLVYQRTDNVDVDFYLRDGDLYVRAES